MNSLTPTKCFSLTVIACIICLGALRSDGQVRIIPIENNLQEEDSSIVVSELPPIISEDPAEDKSVLAPKKFQGAPQIIAVRKNDDAESESPAIKPWNRTKIQELPPVKSWSTKPASFKEDFQHPNKPLPVIHRAEQNQLIDTSKEMVVTIPKSTLKQDQPILYTQQPKPFDQPATADRQESYRRNQVAEVPIYSQRANGPIVESQMAYEEKQSATPENWQANSRRSTGARNRPDEDVRSQIQGLINQSHHRKNSEPLTGQENDSIVVPAQVRSGQVDTGKVRSGELLSKEVMNPYVSNLQASESLSFQSSGRLPQVKPISNPQDVMPETPITQTNELIEYDNSVEFGTTQATFPSTPLAVLRGEALFIQRENGVPRMSQAFQMDPFDFDLGIRIHAERLFGVSGRSLTYTGLQEWNDVHRQTSAGGLGIFSVSGGLPAGTLTPFTGAIFQQQFHRANLHTVELNNVTWGWDVLNLFWGFRFTHYEEEFSFFSARADGQQGLLDLDLENNMFGPQVGGEVFYDIGTRVSTGVKGKVGVMANAFEGQTILISNGTRRINNSDTDVKLNVSAEFGVFARLRMGPRAFLRGGYDLWYNSAVFGARDNIPGVITPGYGSVSFDGDMFIHGATAGFEIVW